MKFKMLVVGLAVLVAGVTSNAQVYQKPAFSAGTPSSGGYTFGTTNFVAVPATGNGKDLAGNQQNTPAVTYINVTSDLAGSKFTLWSSPVVSNGIPSGNAVTTQIYGTQTNSYSSIGVTNFVSTTNGLVVGLPVVVEHASIGNSYQITEPRILAAVAIYNTNTVNTMNGVTNTSYIWALSLNAATTYTTTNGDSIYGYAIQGTIPVGSATVTVGPAPYVWVGQYGIPLLTSINFTSAGSVNTETGEFK
jgi:hypothetical protein